jgi:hypothetical protein
MVERTVTIPHPASVPVGEKSETGTPTDMVGSRYREED